jgi:hypothetical protein
MDARTEYIAMERLYCLKQLFEDYKIICDNILFVIPQKTKHIALLSIVCRINALIVPFIQETTILSPSDMVVIYSALEKVNRVKEWYKVRTDADLNLILQKEYKEFLAEGPAEKLPHEDSNSPKNHPEKKKLNASAEEFIPSFARENYCRSTSISY